MWRVKFAMMIMTGMGVTGAFAQTQVNLQKQSKNVDFSAAISTAPLKTGTVFPATCATGQLFFLLNGTPGSNVYACTSTNTWSLETGGSGGGGGAASSLSDLKVVESSSTVLTIGGTCSSVAPCNARFGNTDYAYLQSSSATISSGTGTAFVYLLSDGSVNVGSSLSVTCNGCTAVPGVTGFPPNSIPLAIWAALNGTWTGSSGLDVRAFQSTTAIVPQTGLLASTAAGQTNLSIDQTVIGFRTSVPPNSSTVCTAGAWAADTSFYYLCVSANAWKRTVLTSF